jgi:hypothetical protein
MHYGTVYEKKNINYITNIKDITIFITGIINVIDDLIKLTKKGCYHGDFSGGGYCNNLEYDVDSKKIIVIDIDTISFFMPKLINIGKIFDIIKSDTLNILQCVIYMFKNLKISKLLIDELDKYIKLLDDQITKNIIKYINDNIKTIKFYDTIDINKACIIAESIDENNIYFKGGSFPHNYYNVCNDNILDIINFMKDEITKTYGLIKKFLIDIQEKGIITEYETNEGNCVINPKVKDYCVTLQKNISDEIELYMYCEQVDPYSEYSLKINSNNEKTIEGTLILSEEDKKILNYTLNIVLTKPKNKDMALKIKKIIGDNIFEFVDKTKKESKEYIPLKGVGMKASKVSYDDKSSYVLRIYDDLENIKNNPNDLFTYDFNGFNIYISPLKYTELEKKGCGFVSCVYYDKNVDGIIKIEKQLGRDKDANYDEENGSIENLNMLKDYYTFYDNNIKYIIKKYNIINDLNTFLHIKGYAFYPYITITNRYKNINKNMHYGSIYDKKNITSIKNINDIQIFIKGIMNIIDDLIKLTNRGCYHGDFSGGGYCNNLEYDIDSKKIIVIDIDTIKFIDFSDIKQLFYIIKRDTLDILKCIIYMFENLKISKLLIDELDIYMKLLDIQKTQNVIDYINNNIKKIKLYDTEDKTKTYVFAESIGPEYIKINNQEYPHVYYAIHDDDKAPVINFIKAEITKTYDLIKEQIQKIINQEKKTQ